MAREVRASGRHMEEEFAADGERDAGADPGLAGAAPDRGVAACLDTVEAGRKLLFFRNDGSAADAQHLAAELTVRSRVNRRAVPALALTTDTSALTAIATDFGFDELFIRQIQALCVPGDW